MKQAIILNGKSARPAVPEDDRVYFDVKNDIIYTHTNGKWDDEVALENTPSTVCEDGVCAINFEEPVVEEPKKRTKRTTIKEEK